MPLRTSAILLFLATFFVSTHSGAAFNTDPRLTWKTIHSEHFEIHFHDGEEELARRVATLAENIHTKLSKYFDWVPSSKTQMVLTDRMDFSNGTATSLPYNRMNIIVSPPDDISLFDNYNDYLEFLIIHEYVHILHIDKATGGASFFRNIFGRIEWLFPNSFQPPWIIEGIATYHESLIKEGVGRGNNNYNRGLMRNEIVNGIKPIYHVNQPTVEWPIGTTRYLYGVYFFKYIKSEYGDEGIKKWVDHHSNNLLPWFINNSSKHAFGKDLRDMWQGFERYLENEFKDDIAQRKQKGLTPATRLTQSGYFTGYPRSLDNGDIYYIKTDLLGESKLMRMAYSENSGIGKPEELRVIRGSRFDIHPQQGILVAELDRENSTNVFSDLYIIDLKSLEKQQITHGMRYVYGAWHPDGQQILAVRNELGQKRLDLLKSDGSLIKTIWNGDNNEVTSHPQWSPDGKTIVTAVLRNNDSTNGANWDLERFDIASQQWSKLTRSPNIEMQPVFSHDGQSILYTADYDGAFNIYQLDLNNNKITQITNELGVAFAATSTQKQPGIYYMGMGKKGFDIFYTEYSLENPNASHVVDASSENTPSSTINLASNASETDYSISPYNPINKLQPRSWFPYLAINDDATQLGATTFGTDPIRRHLYNALIAYDFKNEWLIGGISYIYDRWHPSLKFSGFRSVQTYRDDMNTLLGFVDSDTYTAELIFPFLKRDRQMTFHVGYIATHESTKQVLDTAMPLVSSRDNTIGLAFTYNSAKYYPRAISLNDGQKFRVTYEDSDILESDYTGNVTTVDWRGYFRLSVKQVLSTRVVVGYGTNSPRPFHLGGNLDGYRLDQPGKAIDTPTGAVFNKRQYALRGYPTGLASLRGRRMLLTELEWRFPVLRHERGFMTPPIGLNQISGSIFYNAGDAWQDSFDSSALRDGAGVELISELVFGYNLDFDLRAGYAKGFDLNGESQVYLNIGRTF